MSKRSRTAAPFVVIAAVMLAWGFEIVLGAVPVWGATFLQSQPWQQAVAASYRAGMLPLWSSLAGFGSPLAANPQAAAFSPFVLLSLIAGAERGLALGLLLHANVAGFGAYLAARRLGVASGPAALAGVIFPLSGALAARAIFPAFFMTAAWLGLAVAAWPKGPRRLADALLPAVVLGLAWLDGHPQAWLIVVLASVLSGGWFGLVERHDPLASQSGEVKEETTHPRAVATDERGGRWRSRRWHVVQVARIGGVVVMAVGGGLALAAVQAAPAAELLALSERGSGLSEALVAPYDPPLWAVLLLVAPGLLGTPAGGDYRGAVGFWEWCWTVGLVALPLAAIGRRGLPVLLLTVALVLAFVPGLPVIGPLGRLLAGGDVLRGAGRFLVLADFALALLAAAGLARWLTMPPSTRQRVALVSGSVGLGVLAGALAGREIGGAALLGTGAGLLLAGATMLLAGRLPRLAVPIFIGAVAVELLLFARPLLPLGAPTPTGAPGTPLLTSEPIFLERFFAAFPLAGYSRSFAVPPEVETLPNRGLISGRRDVLSYDPLRLASAGRALAAAGDESIALARLGVGEVAGRGTLSRTRPIVSWASKAVVVTDEAGAFARLFDPALDDDTIVLTGRPPLPPPEGSPDTTRLEVVEARPGRYLIDIARDRPGFLRVLESAYPGWSAVVDGRPAALMTADGLFLGVPLSAGRHVVLLEYRPWSFAIGVAVSAAAWAVVGIALVRRLVAPGRAGPRL